MKKTILKYGLVFLTLLFSLLSWLSVDRAINVPEASVWLAPILNFSLLFIVFSLVVVLIRERYVAEIVSLLIFLISLMFVSGPESDARHLIAIVFGWLLISLAIGRIRRDLQINIKIDLLKTLRTGSSLVVLSFGLVITSQYYHGIKDMSASRLIPKFDLGGATNGLVSQILPAINPDFKNLSDQNLTVDQLILETQKKQLESDGASSVVNVQIDQMIDSQYGASIGPAQKEAIKEEALKKLKEVSLEMNQNGEALILSEGRKKLSEMVGFELKGDEKVGEVMTELINNKINSYFNPSAGNQSGSKVLPFALAVVMFFTVVPIGSFFSFFWILLAQFAFFILVKANLIGITKIQKEMEVIE